MAQNSVTQNSDSVRAEFFYDARNRCVLRKYYTIGSQGQWVLSATDSRALTYDTRWNLLSERTLDGQQAARYIHGARVDEILVAELQSQIGNPKSKMVIYPLTDGLGSTVALADNTGLVQDRYRYTAYGTPTRLTADYIPLPLSSSPFATGFRLLFTGREWLAQVGLNDHRNRYYSPGLGRWLTTDPIGFAANRSNLATYVSNSPLGLRDPLGLFADGDVHETEIVTPIYQVQNCCPKNGPQKQTLTGSASLTLTGSMGLKVNPGEASISISGTITLNYNVPSGEWHRFHAMVTCTYHDPWYSSGHWECVPNGISTQLVICD